MIVVKLLYTLFTTIILTTYSIAQSPISKNEVESVLQETLMKARNAVSNAENNWSYNNTNQDYFTKDTITLYTARSYRRDYCIEIRWSFYDNQKFILENTPECTEPPTMLTPKKDDFTDLECIEKNGNVYLVLKNFKGVYDKFKVLELHKNKPVSSGESMFDYTIILVREK